VAPLFSYAVDDPKGGVNYNICYELATCDLQTYLSNDNNFPRGKSRKRIAHIEQMLTVAEGLKWLMKTTTKEGGLFRALGITHCDLHWRNILLCEDDNHPGSLIFKIGDFGSARNGRDSENKQRSGVAWAERINGQFSAPEPEAHENGDVWSFGCNLLLVYYGIRIKTGFTIEPLAQRATKLPAVWIIFAGVSSMMLTDSSPWNYSMYCRRVY
jgi:serine/threonine protein kinase